MTIKEAQRELAHSLSTVVGKDEARAMSSVIIEHVKGYKPIDVVLYGDRELLDDTLVRMRRIAQAVIDGMPLQYALGTAHFRGRNFTVNPNVLIPRPETAQLIDLIVDDCSGKSDLHVLDIATGSGCIAISLAIDLKFAEVEAIDISPEAIAVARKNANDLSTKVVFRVADALKLNARAEDYDVIVSNPPYVMMKEKAEMDRRVTDYEPAIALFVSDSDPLLFYKAIADFAITSLRQNGRLYFEINPLCANSLCDMLRAKGFADVEIITDYKGNKRFARCVK